MDRLPVGFVYEHNKVLEVLNDYYYQVECTLCGSSRRMWHYNVLRTKACRRCAQRCLEAPITLPDGRRSKEYTAWYSMIARCTQSMPSWRERYGDLPYATMEVDPRWLGPDGYINFYTDLGPAPVGSVLDRRDNTVGYLQGNVRWTSIGKSNENRSNTRFITAFGETRSMAEWADDLGVTATALYQRINVMGWSPEEAVTRPSEQVRPCNEQFFLEIAGRVAKRGTCMRRKVGCVLTDKQNNVLTTAYNATPAGLPHCTDSPCKGAFAKPGENLHSCLAKHAEELALIKCKDIYAIKDCYVTISPCPECVRRLLDTSCQRIIFAEEYADTSAKAIWEKAGRQWVYFLAEDLRPTADLTPLEEAILAKSP